MYTFLFIFGYNYFQTLFIKTKRIFLAENSGYLAANTPVSRDSMQSCNLEGAYLNVLYLIVIFYILLTCLEVMVSCLPSNFMSIRNSL